MSKIEAKQKTSWLAHGYLIIGIAFIILATTLIIIAKYPQVWYTLKIHTTENEFEILTNPVEEDFNKYREEIQERRYIESTLPELDLSLPETNMIKISKIGVDTIIHEGEDYEEALEKGVWRVNDFGTPEDKSLMILAAHRFGYAIWNDEERKLHSFFNLPSTRVGDEIEVIWNQRKYIYKIYKIEEDERITDYSADLILYTCKLYNSPIRIFRYAERIN